jgi:hypothetical protein
MTAEPDAAISELNVRIYRIAHCHLWSWWSFGGQTGGQFWSTTTAKDRAKLPSMENVNG